MPRESVHSADPNFDLQVGWSAERSGGSVQIGIETEDRTSILDKLYGDTLEDLKDIGFLVRQLDVSDHRVSNEELGRAVLDAIEGRKTSFYGAWSTLSRSDCNKLIRLLRKARDSAYGHDE